MLHDFWKTIYVSSTLLSVSLLTANDVLAQATNKIPTDTLIVDNSINVPLTETSASDYSKIDQVTNVNQLRDVSPTDWAYEALRSLVDRYGCIVGFPNQTYRGSQALSRYEFAAGLNSCLNQIERLIAASEAVSWEDIATLQRLSQEFEAELATIGGRVDNLEGRVAFLEDNSFSTTTKLNAEIVNYLMGTFGDEQPDGDDIQDQITFSSRVRLNFDASFTGEDRLRVRLQAANITSPAEAGGTNSLTLNFEGNSENDVFLNDLYYIFPVTERISALIGTNGVDVDEIFDVVPTMGVAYDSFSLYSAYNSPIYANANSGGAAAGFNFDFDWAALDIGYWALNSASPEEGNGLFNGNYVTGANLNIFLLDERLNIALAYLRGYQGEGSDYDLAGFVGTDAATDPFNDLSNSSDNFSIATKFQITDRMAVGGFFGYITASTVEDDDTEADIITWNAYFSLVDLLREGSVFLVSFGQPPSLTDSSGTAIDEDEDNPYLLNVEYRYNLTDNINIAPGGYVLFNPNGDSDNDNIYVGMIRTIFSF